MNRAGEGEKGHTDKKEEEDPAMRIRMTLTVNERRHRNTVNTVCIEHFNKKKKLQL